MEKMRFEGAIGSVQPRIRLTRSFDIREHSYLGFMLRLNGRVDEEPGVFTIGIGPGTQGKHKFRTGMSITGECVPVADTRLEPVEFYKVSKVYISDRPAESDDTPPPWIGEPPALEVYRDRGHRRLASQTYERECRHCIWGCRMAVEMIIDHWKPDIRKYRNETFCYGPLSCPLYRPGPTRKVPGRKGMTWEEEDWVDEQDTNHREPDE